jgi:hypothetical protein
MGEHPLHGLRVPLHELTRRELTLVNYLVKIIYRSHLYTASTIV